MGNRSLGVCWRSWYAMGLLVWSMMAIGGDEQGCMGICTWVVEIERLITSVQHVLEITCA